jgi:hypothetical protein
MAETPLGVSFEERDDGQYILRQKNTIGDEAQIRLTEEELQDLKSTIDLWPDRKMSSFQVGSAPPRQVICHAVVSVGSWPDAVQENVLLSMRTKSAETVFEVPRDEVENIAYGLLRVLETMGPISTKQ